MGIVFIVEDDRGPKCHAVKTLQRRFRRELYLLRRFVRRPAPGCSCGDH